MCSLVIPVTEVMGDVCSRPSGLVGRGWDLKDPKLPGDLADATFASTYPQGGLSLIREGSTQPAGTWARLVWKAGEGQGDGAVNMRGGLALGGEALTRMDVPEPVLLSENCREVKRTASPVLLLS